MISGFKNSRRNLETLQQSLRTVYIWESHGFEKYIGVRFMPITVASQTLNKARRLLVDVFTILKCCMKDHKSCVICNQGVIM